MILGMLGGGDKPGTASRELGAQTSGDLSSLISSLGFTGPPMNTGGAVGQSQAQGMTPEQMKAIMGLFQKKPQMPPPNQGFDTPTNMGDIAGLV